MNITKTKSLRKIILPLLKKLNPGKISIRHHYTKNKFVLDAFLHKGYWFHGKKREIDTMKLFSKLIQPGFTVIEVGGHIGYITNYFSYLVKQQGKVYVFEPGENNLPYLEENISKLGNVNLIKKAVSDNDGMAQFHIENISGQNNSLLPKYGKAVQEMAYVKRKEKIVEVETIKLDSFCSQEKIEPHFIKIDIEGAELMAVNGMQQLLCEKKPMLMIEITKNRQEIYQLLQQKGYILINPEFKEINTGSHYGNTFCLHKEKHKQQFKQFEVKLSANLIA